MIENILAKDAVLMINSCQNVKLVDVRTPAEWKEGVPNIANDKILFCEWQVGNSEFFDKLTQEIPNKETLIFFLCRSGVRSKFAASGMLDLGYMKCYNIIDGFSGTNQNNGWINSKLAWLKPY